VKTNKPTGKRAIGAFGLFAPWLPVDWDRLTANWEALEDLCREYCGGLWIGIYSGYDLIRWGREVGIIRPFEYEAYFNMLQN
jgi:hypothetical protein